ncbi:MAG: hypothetical protein Q8O00_09955, partial [Holophaga sp.]|nr:hypothetical protein [Holophaga sp.]
SWSALGLGILALATVGGMTWRAYHLANRVGREAFLLSRQTQDSIARQGSIQNQLKAINVQKELPRWRLAERILGERSSPWSRLTAELERSLVQDMRIRGLQRSRGADQQVIVKLKGEARTRAAEAAFVESVEKNPYFSQIILERENERPGGGIEFEFTMPLAAIPPTYVALPTFGPRKIDSPKATASTKAPGAAPIKAVAKPTTASNTPVAAILPKPMGQRSGIAAAGSEPQGAPTRPLRQAPEVDSEDARPRRRPGSRTFNRPNPEERR